MNYEEIIPERMHHHHPKYVLEDIRVAGEILASWEKTKWGLNAALKHLAFLLLLIPLVHLLWTVVQTVCWPSDSFKFLQARNGYLSSTIFV